MDGSVDAVMADTDLIAFSGLVRDYYDNGAAEAYRQLLGKSWHHGDEKAHNAGMSPAEAALDMQKQIAKDTRLQAGQRAMDFGSGLGEPTVVLSQLTGARFVGVANSATLTAAARDMAAAMNMTHMVSFHDIGDTEYLTLDAWPDGCFDAVTAFESVVHLPDKAAFFKAVWRVLRPGGRIGMVDWIQRRWGAEFRTPAQIEAVMGPVNDAISIPFHATVEQYEEWLQDAGFVDIQVRDLFPSGPCWGSTPDEDVPRWHGYEGPRQEVFRLGKFALDRARKLGVFSVAKLVAEKPMT